MTTSTVTVRVDEATKREAARIAEDFGLDLSSITRAFYRQVVREQRIPLTLEYPQPNAETQEAIADSLAMEKEGISRFKNAQDMFDALGI